MCQVLHLLTGSCKLSTTLPETKSRPLVMSALIQKRIRNTSVMLPPRLPSTAGRAPSSLAQELLGSFSLTLQDWRNMLLQSLIHSLASLPCLTPQILTVNHISSGRRAESSFTNWKTMSRNRAPKWIFFLNKQLEITRQLRDDMEHKITQVRNRITTT